MKQLVLFMLLIPIVLSADTAFRAICFESDSAALAWVEVLESRMPHQPGWRYTDPASPTTHLTDGRCALRIVDSAVPYLTDEEKAIIEDIDSSLIPEPPNPYPEGGTL